MKTLSKLFSVCVFFASAAITHPATAQSNIAFIDVEAIFQQMPQYVTAQQKIAAEFKDRTEEVERLRRDIEYQVDKHGRDAATMSEQQIKDLETKIVDLRNEFAEKAPRLQEDIQRRLNQERTALLGLIETAMKEIIDEQNLDAVFRKQSATFAKPELDISQQVLDRITQNR